MIRLMERLIEEQSGIRSQVVMYVLAAILQGIVLAAIIPVLRALFAGNLAEAFTWIAVGGSGALVSGIVTWIANNVGYSVGIDRLGGGLMHSIGRRLPQLPLGWFTDRTAATLTTVMSSSVQNVLNLPSLIIQQLATAVITPATVVLITLFVDPWLGLAFIPLVPLAWWLYRRIDRVGRETDEIENAGERDVSARVIEFAQAQPVLRASGRTQDGWSPLTSALERDRCATIEALRRKGRPSAAFTAVVSLGFAAIFVATVASVGLGRIDVAAVAGVLILALRFVEPLSAVGAYGSGVTTARSALSEIASVIDQTALPEPVHPLQPVDSSVEFRDVSFGYGPDRVLEGFSLRCEPGTTTALVGASGSGKTTATRLVGRFWDVDSGSVRVGGVDVREIATPTLMSVLSFVFQHVYLMDDTILANVRLGRPDATAEEVAAAARAARLDEVVERLPHGWDSLVGEGGKRLSGGERQRVSIARAILKDAPIVLLDEATASLDAENERAIAGAIRTLTAGKTVLVIAHRLASIAEADNIAVLDNGRIDDYGTHDELLSRPGIYSRFWSDRLEATQWKLSRHTDEHSKGNS